MGPDERRIFGVYMRQLREKQGMSLRDVEGAVRGVKLSNSYLYQIERGDRNSPKLEIMRELARLYKVPLGSLMAAAGYQEATEIDLYQNEIDCAFEYIRNDKRFRFGMQAQGENLTIEAKRFMVELYQRAHPEVNLLTKTTAEHKPVDDDEELEDE